MRPSSPYDWSKHRVLTGMGIAITVPLAVGVVTGSVVAAVLIAGLIVLADSILSRLTPGPSATATARLTPRDGAVMPTLGDRLDLTIELTALRGGGSALVVPVIPHGVVLEEPGGYVGELEAASPATLRFTVSATAAGHCTLPGVRIRTASPLRLFSRSSFVRAGSSMFFMPVIDEVQDLELRQRLRRSMRDEHRMRRVVRGGGSRFRELREYQFPEPLGRVDWRATARRGRLIVREYEEPLELNVHVVLDASADMTHAYKWESRFAMAATLVLRLAGLAQMAGARFTLHAYDREPVLSSTLRDHHGGLARLAGEVWHLPRAALLRSAGRILRQRSLLSRTSAAHIDRLIRRWHPAQSIVANPEESSASLESLLADVDPWFVLNERERCEHCRAQMLSDDAACPHGCGGSLALKVPPRAATAIEIIRRITRQAHERTVLVFISAIEGGEASLQTANILRHAAGRRLRVHVVIPEGGGILQARPNHPGSLGHSPLGRDVLVNVNRLRDATALLTLSDALQDAGIDIWMLDQPAALEALALRVMNLLQPQRAAQPPVIPPPRVIAV